MKKMILIAAAITVVATLSGCNSAARKYGGNESIDLPKNQKLVTITWKDSELWYLTRPMIDGEKAEDYKFQEKSNFGILEGTVTIHEHE